MSEQPIEEAFSLLEVSMEATQEEIEKAYKTKSKKYHPDKTGGEHGIQSKLNEAREIAVAFSKIKTAVVPISVGQSLQRVERELIAQRAFINANESARIAKRHKTRPLQRLRSIMWAVGGVIAILALFGNNVLPIITISKLAKTFLVLFTFTFGITGLFIQLMINRLQNSINSYMEVLSDRRECANELAKTLSFKDFDEVTEEDMLNLAKDPRLQQGKSLTFILTGGYSPWSSEELRNLLLLKSEEHGLIVPVVQEIVTPNSVPRFRLRFQPSLFRPKPEPK